MLIISKATRVSAQKLACPVATGARARYPRVFTLFTSLVRVKIPYNSWRATAHVRENQSSAKNARPSELPFQQNITTLNFWQPNRVLVTAWCAVLDENLNRKTVTARTQSCNVENYQFPRGNRQHDHTAVP